MRERQVAGYCQGVVVPARQDALAFTRWKRTQVAVISSGTMQIEQPELLRSPCARTMLFHGAFSWPVNRSTAEYLVNDIFPEVRKMEGAIELRIAGQPIPEELKNASSQPGIFMEGYVDDLRAWLSQCSVYVMPMLQGGGVKTKLFEAMAMGLPIVTNSMGAEAMDDVAKQCLVVADGTRPIADAVVRLIRNPKEAEAMGVRARQHAVKHFQWSRLSAQYRDFLLRIGSVAKVEDCPC
jgi:glycosyltransferase involved in cell wall biosynthesis